MPPPKYPKTNDERAKVYLHCMQEIKERLNLINLVRQQPTQILFVKEICYLELRYVCELIAIACLTAQGDFKTQRAFTKEYSPPVIFAALKKIYPEFFPKPSATITSGNRHHIKIDHRPEAYNENDITDLWRQAGSHLHRTSVNKYLKKTFGRPPELSNIDDHLRGIVALLDCHILPIQTTLTHNLWLQIVMENGPDECEAIFMHVNEKEGKIQLDRYTSTLVKRT